MKFAVDTGAALSLASSAHFQKIVNLYDLIITEAIEAELIQFAAYNDDLGLKAQEILKMKLSKKQPHHLLPLFLEKGEIEVFSLAWEEKMPALTDDVRAARVVREKYSVEVRPSFYILLLLYKNKKISKEELIIDMNSILIRRNWLTGALWGYAQNLIKNL